MSKVSSTIEINGPIEEVYALAKEVETFPEFMPDVKSVKIVEKSADGSRVVSEWVGIVRNSRPPSNGPKKIYGMTPPRPAASRS